MLVYPVDPTDPEDVPTAYLRRASQAEARDGHARERASKRSPGRPQQARGTEQGAGGGDPPAPETDPGLPGER